MLKGNVGRGGFSGGPSTGASAPPAFQPSGPINPPPGEAMNNPGVHLRPPIVTPMTNPGVTLNPPIVSPGTNGPTFSGAPGQVSRTSAPGLGGIARPARPMPGRPLPY